MPPPRAPTLESLLAHGYFPRELPPPFTTRDFGAFAVRHTGSWSAKAQRQWTQCVSHNLARSGGLRRPLSIPNPRAFFRLADLLASNWTAVRSHTWRSNLSARSASRPYVMSKSHRAIMPRYRYGVLPRLRARTRRGVRYLLCTDIAQFYPSLYTHSIPWALYGKTASKAALATRTRSPRRFGDKLDAALRHMNHGQTNGIPIGPDTSLVVAELVLSAVDVTLNKNRALSGFRYVDDYELAFATQPAAEEALAVIQNALNDLGLILNPRKTFIQELPRSLNNRWAIELSRFPLRGSDHPSAQSDDIVNLFSLAFEAFSTDSGRAALQYAISRVRNVPLHEHAWRTLQNCLFTAATADASTLRWVLDMIVATHKSAGYPVDKDAFADTCSYIIQRHAPQGHGSEVAWALWGCLALDVTLSSSVSQLLGQMNDDVVALLALQCDARKLLLSGSLDRQLWTASVAAPDVALSDHWLLAYEGHVKGWLPNPGLSTDPIFGPMLRAKVSFFDSHLCTPQSLAAALQFPGGQLTAGYA